MIQIQHKRRQHGASRASCAQPESIVSEKRQFPRLELNSTVLIAGSRRAWLCQVEDVSIGGARVVKPLDWLIQDATDEGVMRLHFIIDEDTIVSLYSRIVRDSDQHFGVRFEAGQDDEVDRLLYETRFAEL
jgi:hypothetical protein